MLTLTEAAADVIHRLTSRSGMPAESGLRISPRTDGDDGSGTALTVSLADGPSPRDAVVEMEQARVYLEPDTVEPLDDKVLDARVDEQGTVSFQVRQQPGDSEPSM